MMKLIFCYSCRGRFSLHNLLHFAFALCDFFLGNFCWRFTRVKLYWLLFNCVLVRAPNVTQMLPWVKSRSALSIFYVISRQTCQENRARIRSDFEMHAHRMTNEIWLSTVIAEHNEKRREKLSNTGVSTLESIIEFMLLTVVRTKHCYKAHEFEAQINIEWCRRDWKTVTFTVVES